MSEAEFCTKPLDRNHDRAAFSCGVEPLDRYFRQQAGQDRARRAVAVYVLEGEPQSVVVGFYTLSAFSIYLTDLPPEITRRLPRYDELPAVMLGRMAVDTRWQGQHLGEKLLIDALRRSYGLTDQIGAVAVVLDAKNDGLLGFYGRYGFQQLGDNRYRLFLPMGTIKQLFEQVS
jgi:GNAT superfamily N-acetyltransferase